MYHYEKTKQTLLAELHSNQETGLRALDIPALQVRHGKNQFEEQKGEGIFKKVVHTLSDISVIILLIAAALSLFMGIYHGEGYV
ncbi:MAG: cation-transporting P-type ATPase, partial [Oscillospiraceae bacterium]|nr:cation-transporting P-type ATPase [Oscillospiraceae bacterium]